MTFMASSSSSSRSSRSKDELRNLFKIQITKFVMNWNRGWIHIPEPRKLVKGIFWQSCCFFSLCGFYGARLCLQPVICYWPLFLQQSTYPSPPPSPMESLRDICIFSRRSKILNLKTPKRNYSKSYWSFFLQQSTYPSSSLSKWKVYVIFVFFNTGL